MLGCRQLLSIDDGKEAPRADAAPEGDAAAPVEDGGASSAYCASLDPQPQFCADFDDDKPVTRGWANASSTPDPFVTGAGGTLTPDLVNFRSGPRGAAIGIAALLAPSKASVALVKTFSAPPGHLTLDFDIRIDTEDFREPGQVLMLVSLAFPTGQIAIGRTKAGLTLATFDETAQDEAKSDEPLAVGAWRRLSLLIAGAEVTLQVDGALAAKLKRPANLGGKGTTYLGIGASGAQGTMGAFRATIDNVSFTSDAPLRN